jgi:hypothetical protein
MTPHTSKNKPEPIRRAPADGAPYTAEPEGRTVAESRITSDRDRALRSFGLLSGPVLRARCCRKLTAHLLPQLQLAQFVSEKRKIR